MPLADVSLRHKTVWFLRGPQDAAALRSAAQELVDRQVVTEAALDVRSSGPGPDAPAGPGELSALLHLYEPTSGASFEGDAVRVLERVVYDRRSSPGEWAWSQGWIRIGTQVRQPHLTRAQFAAHWGAVHAELVRAHHPGAVRYAQSHVLSDAPFDGFYESYFPTAEDWTERLFDSPIGEQRLTADADGFLSEAGSERLWVTRERFVPDWREYVPR